MNEVHELLIEAAIEERHPVRLERVVGAGRVSTRIVLPVRLESVQEVASGAAALVARTADRREQRIDMAEVDDVSIVTTGLRPEEESRGGWTVGDAVLDGEFGLGVVQGFVAGENEVLVRFGAGGPRRLPIGRTALRPRGR